VLIARSYCRKTVWSDVKVLYSSVYKTESKPIFVFLHTPSSAVRTGVLYVVEHCTHVVECTTFYCRGGRSLKWRSALSKNKRRCSVRCCNSCLIKPFAACYFGTTLWFKKTSPFFILLWLLQTLTSCCNIWCRVYQVNLQLFFFFSNTVQGSLEHYRTGTLSYIIVHFPTSPAYCCCTTLRNLLFWD